MTGGSRDATGWLFGPALDLGVGCGLAYLLSVPALFALAGSTGTSAWPIGWVGFFALAINAPHYGATLVRAYEDPTDRTRYAFFTVWVTIALMALFVGGLRSAWLGSALITLYISWSPWHFSGQNYGLAVMFLRRNGVAISDGTKRRLQLSFVLAFALALVATHVADSSAIYAPGFSSKDSFDYEVIRLGIPPSVAGLLFAAFATLYAGCLLWVFLDLRGATTWRAGLPVALLVATQALWFVAPAGLQLLDERTDRALPLAVIWISTAHSAQYLWVSAYYAKRTGARGRPALFLTKSLAAGTLATVLPGLLVAATSWGPSWSGGLGVLVFAMVNLHHFLLDGAIWKLRDGRVARVLIRPVEEDAAVPIGPARFPWVGALLGVVGVLCLAVPVVQTWELATGFGGDGDAARLDRTARRLEWIGRGSPEAWTQLGVARERKGEIDEAIAAYRKALDLQARHPLAGARLARALAIYRGDDPGRVEEALALAERANRATGDRNPAFLDTLAIAEAAAGRFEDARRTAERALTGARASAQYGLAAGIQGRLRGYERGEPFRGEDGGGGATTSSDAS